MMAEKGAKWEGRWDGLRENVVVRHVRFLAVVDALRAPHSQFTRERTHTILAHSMDRLLTQRCLLVSPVHPAAAATPPQPPLPLPSLRRAQLVDELRTW